MATIRIKINGQEDRRQVAAILADNGYDVVIEKRKRDITPYDYYWKIKSSDYDYYLKIKNIDIELYEKKNHK